MAFCKWSLTDMSQNVTKSFLHQWAAGECFWGKFYLVNARFAFVTSICDVISENLLFLILYYFPLSCCQFCFIMAFLVSHNFWVDDSSCKFKSTEMALSIATNMTHTMSDLRCSNFSVVSGSSPAGFQGCKTSTLLYRENLNQQLKIADLCRRSTPNCWNKLATTWRPKLLKMSNCGLRYMITFDLRAVWRSSCRLHFNLPVDLRVSCTSLHSVTQTNTPDWHSF